jgi:hypothetical protein
VTSDESIVTSGTTRHYSLVTVTRVVPYQVQSVLDGVWSLRYGHAKQAIEKIHRMSSFREDSMSRGWMPRRCVPMKDVA